MIDGAVLDGVLSEKREAVWRKGGCVGRLFATAKHLTSSHTFSRNYSIM